MDPLLVPAPPFSIPLEALWTCVVLALVVSGTSHTITGTDVFEPFRNFVIARSAWLGKLVSCFYCTSHWIAFFLVALYRPTLLTASHAFVNLAVTAFFVIQLATFFTGVAFKSFSVILPVKMAMEEAKAKAREKAAAAKRE